jgi:hypothetical protein
MLIIHKPKTYSPKIIPGAIVYKPLLHNLFARLGTYIVYFWSLDLWDNPSQKVQTKHRGPNSNESRNYKQYIKLETILGEPLPTLML